MLYSLQSEGVHAGVPAVFIRFADCGLRCSKARAAFAAEFPVRDRLTANEVAKLARICSFRCTWAILAGAEPALQVDAELVDALHAVGFRVAIETNGTIVLGQSAFDWVTVLPRDDTEVRVRCTDEIRYVIRHGDPIPLPPIPAKHEIAARLLFSRTFPVRRGCSGQPASLRPPAALGKPYVGFRWTSPVAPRQRRRTASAGSQPSRGLSRPAQLPGAGPRTGSRWSGVQRRPEDTLRPRVTPQPVVVCPRVRPTEGTPGGFRETCPRDSSMTWPR